MQLCSYAVMQFSKVCRRDKAMPCLYDFHSSITISKSKNQQINKSIVKGVEQNLEDLAGGDGDGSAGAEYTYHP